MNERQPYEHLIANKLQQLPVPDPDESWQEMKRLLDEDRSPRGAYGKRSGPGRGRWWGAGIIAAVLVTGTWVYMQHHDSSKEGLASLKHTPAQNSATAAGNKDTPGKESNASNTPSNNNQTTNAPGKTSTLQTTEPASLTNTADSKTGANGSVSNDNSNTAGSPALLANRNSATPAPASEHRAKETGKDQPVVASNSLPVAKEKPETAYSKSHPKHKNSSDKSTSSRYRRNLVPPATTTNNNGTAATAARVKKAPGNKKPAANILNHPADKSSTAHTSKPRNRRIHNNGNIIAGTTGDKRTQRSKPLQAASTAARHPGASGSKPGNGNPVPATDPLLAKQQERRQRLAELEAADPSVAINTSLATGDSINSSIDTSDLLNDSTKAQMAKAKLPEPTKAVVKKDKKPFRLNLDLSLPPLNPLSMRNDNDPWWGAGLSFNAPVPIAGQTHYKFNSNGSTSLLTDYLPSPYLEFHMNQYVFLQTEINLSAPQYTPNLLLYHKTNEISGSTPAIRNETSINVQKLYYFNWPFSIHYAPFDNLYLSAGIQFSSFQSGLAMINTKNYPVGASATDTAYHSKLVKFKDDSIAVRFSPTEWRWQLGAEYYFSRFTVGVRYNRSFKSLVIADPTGSLPGAGGRNSAVLFFLRFNIFEGRSKDPNVSAPPSSLVRY